MYNIIYTNVRCLRSKFSEMEFHLKSKTVILFLSERGTNASILAQRSQSLAAHTKFPISHVSLRTI